MRVLLLSGSHPRHAFVHSEFFRHSFDVAAIVMQRESLVPDPPLFASSLDCQLFNKHFSDRKFLEDKAFGTSDANDLYKSISTYNCSPTSLNSPETADFASSFNPDLAFVFGTDIIKPPLLEALPDYTINLHLGLSPWYRGSATLFWPFYYLQPQFCGATFHKIVLEADAGDILHQFTTDLHPDDKIHDVGVRTVVQARNELRKLLSDISIWAFSQQKTSGRLFLTRDFQPAHLRLIYDTFDNDIVRCYLDGLLEQRLPKLISAF